jgi:hypothetical protein
MINLGLGLHAAGKPDQALPLFQEAAEGVEKRRFQHEHAGPIVNNLVAAHERSKQFDRAEAWRRKWLAAVKARDGPESTAYADELAGLGANLLRQTRPGDAEPVLRECLAVRQKVQPEAWPTFDARSLLGGALVGQQRYAEAEPLLLTGYEGMKRRDEKATPRTQVRLAEALERLVRLYDGWGMKDKADGWRKELDAVNRKEPN